MQTTLQALSLFISILAFSSANRDLPPKQAAAQYMQTSEQPPNYIKAEYPIKKTLKITISSSIATYNERIISDTHPAIECLQLLYANAIQETLHVIWPSSGTASSRFTEAFFGSIPGYVKYLVLENFDGFSELPLYSMEQYIHREERGCASITPMEQFLRVMARGNLHRITLKEPPWGYWQYLSILDEWSRVYHVELMWNGMTRETAVDERRHFIGQVIMMRLPRLPERISVYPTLAFTVIGPKLQVQLNHGAVKGRKMEPRTIKSIQQLYTIFPVSQIQIECGGRIIKNFYKIFEALPRNLRHLTIWELENPLAWPLIRPSSFECEWKSSNSPLSEECANTLEFIKSAQHLETLELRRSTIGSEFDDIWKEWNRYFRKSEIQIQYTK